ncbi:MULTISPECIES: acyl-CoA dehydrogenase family protein [Metallosphaera]|uniref:Acyl-CoA dehydrogenase domain protein n=3 Tax=Metallosphaera TaxID=41980 RepID=A4YDF1_METS5|nr:MULTISPECIES: acyl-CoA dehydrogenase family protein [Metallosphaera]ABP94453.1 acyl-CoA dehydrogenase domain protein [Metallosphaera sedula DSM 5348]AIM26440.1 acyl-CoA dehydrogenase domain protein [Metallosphaera sedula]AKV73441.1 acyl-CoA dehydrogenase [Metallosphaera sedula]AKV75684.1 acyl-CoA dehydrogenase [Metallosphaera sedula]AKV77930.1 acyl-CoA dehydrogenase [Metallosphaera sedula]
MVFPFKGLEDFKIDLDQDHELLRTTIRDFLEREVQNRVEEGERKGDLGEVREKIKELGLNGLDVPQEYGGAGGDYLSLLVATEEISRIWPSLSTFFLINWMFTSALLRFGGKDIKERYVPPVARGEKIAAFANTEPGAGTDVAGMSSVAKKVNGGYVLTGKKIFITSGDLADYIIVTARTSPPSEQRWKGITMFVVERDFPGFKVESRIDTTGLKASHTTEISFNEVKVPEENVVGEVGQGFKYAVSSFDYARTIVASQALGIGQAALEKMVRYSMDRKSFGQSIAGFQMVQQKVSESMADLTTTRLLVYWAGSLYKRGMENEYIMAASLAKFFATEAAERIVLRAMTVHGGYGVTTSTGLERMLRDIQILKTYEGTNDIQRVSAARHFYRKFMGLNV